jgi:energy-converting hydrogenase Eha subunit G
MQVYADLFAIVTLFSGGGLAAYGLLLYNKMCRVKTSQASADIHKVAGLAVASVVCFSLRAFVVLFFDNPFINIWDLEHVKSQLHPLLTFLYYVIGFSLLPLSFLTALRCATCC